MSKAPTCCVGEVSRGTVQRACTLQEERGPARRSARFFLQGQMSSDTSVGVVAKREPGVPARFRSLDLDDPQRPPRSRKRRRPGLPGRLRLAWSAPLAGRTDLDEETAQAAGLLLAMANSPVSSERREAERKVSGEREGGGVGSARRGAARRGWITSALRRKARVPARRNWRPHAPGRAPALPSGLSPPPGAP